MIWIILQFVILSLLFVLPILLYKTDWRYMEKILDRMILSVKARRLYAQVLLILLLLFHYVYTSVHPGEFGVLFSTIVCAAMFSPKRTGGWICYLIDKPRAFVKFALVTLVIAFIPHLYTLAVTFAFLLLAALIYSPIRMATIIADLLCALGEWCFSGQSAESDYDNRPIELPYDVDSGNTTDSDNPNNDKSSKTELK